MPLLKMNQMGEIVTIGFDGEMGSVFDSIVGAVTGAVDAARKAASTALSSAAKVTAIANLKSNPIVATVVKVSPIPKVIQIVKKPSLGTVLSAAVSTVSAPSDILKAATGGKVDIFGTATGLLIKPQAQEAPIEEEAAQETIEEIQYVDEYGNPMTAEQVAAAEAANAAAMQPEQTATPGVVPGATSTIVSSGTPLKTATRVVVVTTKATANINHPMAVYGLA